MTSDPQRQPSGLPVSRSSDATPRPWRIERVTFSDRVWIASEDQTPVCAMLEPNRTVHYGFIPFANNEANAALIVEAVNAYDAHKACAEALRPFAKLREQDCIGLTHREIKAAQEALAALEKANG